MIPPATSQLLLAAALAASVALVARQARALSASGATAAALIGFLILGLGGWPGATALLLFFFSSSGLSRFRKRDKDRLGYEKGGERDAHQVLANGGVAAVCALLLPLFPDTLWPRVALLGALAAANADTWATEIGSLSRRAPRLITTFAPALPGASGAVSWPGTAAALAGALLIALVGLGWEGGSGVLLAVALGGFAGALTDSVLGATIQAQFRCPVCQALTERQAHCDGQATQLARGVSFLGNDWVNALATLAGALVAAALWRGMVP